MRRSFVPPSAVRLADHGFDVLSLRRNGKIPAIRGWQDPATNDRDALANLFYVPDLNVGMKTGKVIGLDFDVKAAGFAWIEAHRSDVTVAVETARGVHCWFSAAGPVPTMRIENGDVKALGGLLVCPESRVDGWTYRYLPGHDLVPIDKLTPFDPSLVKPLVETKKAIRRDPIRNAIKYVMAVESVQGQHGSSSLVRACSILRDAGYTEAEATVVMIEWNNSGKAVPPWSLKELTRAISRTFANGEKR